MMRAATLLVLAIAIALIGFAACASIKTTTPARKPPVVVTQATPSAQPTATGAPISTHAPYAITAGLDGNLWFTEYQATASAPSLPTARPGDFRSTRTALRS